MLLNISNKEKRFTEFNIGKSIFNIATYHLQFNEWQKNTTIDTYNGKQLLNFNDQPLFAELCVQRILEQDGYNAVWADTYRNKFWKDLPSLGLPVLLDSIANEKYNMIKKENYGKRGGCWDIFAFTQNHFLFLELKRIDKGSDRIREKQINWFNAAMKVGFTNDNFGIVEWSVK